MHTSQVGCRSLWEQMAPEQRSRAAHHFWHSDNASIQPERNKGILVIAKARRSREAKIRRASLGDLERWIVAVPQLPEDIAGALIRTYLLHEHLEMIVDFLDGLRIPHTLGLISDAFNPLTLQKQELVQGAQRLTESYGEGPVSLYFAYAATNADAWGEAIRGTCGSPKPAEAPIQSDNPLTTEQVNAGDDWLTNLDELLDRAISATVSESPGALNNNQLEDAIEELLQNNPYRAKTYFHKGYLDVRLERLLQPHFKEENRDRRLWYLAGAIRAMEDRGDRNAILDLFERENVRDLGREQNQRAELACGPIFKALCEAKRSAAAVEFLAPDLVFRAELFEWSLDFGTKLLRAQEVESALRLFELLNVAADRTSADQIAALGGRYFDLKRRQAHCLRFQRHFGAAVKILRELIQASDAPERSAMMVDMALMEAGFRGLLEIVVPSKDLNQFISRLEQIRPQLEVAESIGGNCAHATYCLGVLAIAKQSDPAKAAEWLDKSVTDILRHSTEYDLEGLLSRARFYMGLARTEALDTTFAEKAGALFHDAIYSGFVPPDHLLSRYIVGLSVISNYQAMHAAETAVSKLGASRVLGSILDTEVASQSSVILGRLLECGLDERRSGKQRFLDLSRILKHAINGNHNEIAVEALDGMEQLARSGFCTDEFLTLLRDDGSFHPAWSKSDAAWSAAGLCERKGKLTEARQMLESEFHHILSDRPHGFLEQADDILAKLGELGADANELSALKKRLKEVQDHSAVPVVSLDMNAIPIRVTVVGGDERQADFDKGIINRISLQMGAVEIQFRHTGWSGRWGPVFDAMRPTLDRSDVVVVLRLIRTNLGRRVREYAKVWIGCAGYSRLSIERAIKTGVDLVRKEKALASQSAGQD